MRYDLKDIIDLPGESKAVSFSLDLSQEEINFQRPAAQPLTVTGSIKNLAGVLTVLCRMKGVLTLKCDRCGREFTRELDMPIEAVAADSVEDEESLGEIVLLEGTVLDMGELARSTFILDFEISTLCSEDCKGLCQTCGKNLNDGPCGCETKYINPAFEKLSELLDDMKK